MVQYEQRGHAATFSLNIKFCLIMYAITNSRRQWKLIHYQSCRHLYLSILNYQYKKKTATHSVSNNMETEDQLHHGQRGHDYIFSLNDNSNLMTQTIAKSITDVYLCTMLKCVDM